MSLRRRTVVTTAALVVCLTAALVAQRRGFGGGFRGFGGGPRGPFHQYPNIPYDGRFTFVRVKYQHAPGGNWYSGWPAWSHGYPLAESNLMKIMNEVSFLSPHTDEINTLDIDDPGITKYPIAYIIEVDWWMMTDHEAAALRDYMQKGGFVIIDDFKPQRFRGGFGAGPGGYGYGTGWEVFEANMKRVMPTAKFVDLDLDHPIFHSFFEIKSLEIPQAYVAGEAIFRGLYEDNDPKKRLQMIVNYNTDVSQFWEWSGLGLRPIDDTNEAYKLGVNYLMYGMTH
ncbi:MAG: DUF4159 domain-containing protein [Acidobacteriia bacterium]|nr:DUF4159 domain-containing protein [Terriglobia bacterium]